MGGILHQVVESGRNQAIIFHFLNNPNGKAVILVLFTGEYNHSFDQKGRLIMPAKFREMLGDVFYVTKGTDHCLTIYTIAEYEAYVEKLKALPSTTSASVKNFIRFITTGAITAEVDKQGRILIPAHLREYAGLDKDVVVAGVADKIEIWNSDKYYANQADCEENIEDILQQMADLGINI